MVTRHKVHERPTDLTVAAKIEKAEVVKNFGLISTN